MIFFTYVMLILIDDGGGLMMVVKLICLFIVHRFFSTGVNMTEIICASPGSTKSTGRSP